MDFESIQKFWYQKLKDSGFEDIEKIQRDHRFVLKNHHSHYLNLKYTRTRNQSNRFYYEISNQILNDYPFKCEKEKLIWEHHNDGKSIRKISKELSISCWKVFKTLKEIRKSILVGNK